MAETEDIDGFKLKGWVKWEHRKESGLLVNLFEGPNIITAAGKAGVASRLNTSSPGTFIWIGVGTGATAASTTDVTLQTELTSGGMLRASATASSTTTVDAGDTAKLVYTFTASTSFAITESGVMATSSSGPLLSRQTFAAVNMTSGDTLQVTWQISVA